MVTSSLSILPDIPHPGDRRRSLRHKVYSPAYASFSGLGGGMVLDLSEIRDISSEGMSLQLDSALEVNRSLNIVLDLPETKTYINTTGTVIWTDAHGRCGIRFLALPQASLGQLNLWLLFNTLAALTKRNDLSVEVRVSEGEETQFARAESAYLAERSTLDAIFGRVEDLRDSLPAALEFLADCARRLTAASGAAIALGDREEMVCQASSGAAPAIGARFKIGSGFSGECVRTAEPGRCDDAEANPLVDRESCRALGIRSLVAIPLVTSEGIVGLLEVFSPRAHAFGESDVVELGRLAEIITRVVPRPASIEAKARATEEPAVAEKSVDKIFRIAATVLILAALIASLTLLTRTRPATPAAAVAPPPLQQKALPAQPTALADLRRLADMGDPVAQFTLGARYAQGDEVEQDYAEAVRWFEKAANQGHVLAQATLGAYYWAGRGVPEDLTRAYFWSLLARAGGDEASKFRVATLTPRMTKTQVAQAEQQAREWLGQHQRTP